ncbi:MAG TPA: hypothetical protein VFB58_03330 [Chloroflexota bacterium]|nr:hypothetical protein [Chloroflexota bacterium]
MQEDPTHCTICGQRLHRLKHPVAHSNTMRWDAEIRTCPHNIHRTDHYGDPRHDEWHLCDHGWVQRES